MPLRVERDVGPAEALQLREPPRAAHGSRQLADVIHSQQGIPAVGGGGLLPLLRHGEDVGKGPAGGRQGGNSRLCTRLSIAHHRRPGRERTGAHAGSLGVCKRRGMRARLQPPEKRAGTWRQLSRRR